MRIIVTARHCEIGEDLRTRARDLLDRLAQRSRRAQGATVVFDDGPLQRTAEIRVRLRGGEVLVATAEGDAHRTALDRAAQRIRRQLERPAAKPERRKAVRG
jgi:ribosomal subunit interface protein